MSNLQFGLKSIKEGHHSIVFKSGLIIKENDFGRKLERMVLEAEAIQTDPLVYPKGEESKSKLNPSAIQPDQIVLDVNEMRNELNNRDLSIWAAEKHVRGGKQPNSAEKYTRDGKITRYFLIDAKPTTQLCVVSNGSYVALNVEDVKKKNKRRFDRLYNKGLDKLLTKKQNEVGDKGDIERQFERDKRSLEIKVAARIVKSGTVEKPMNPQVQSEIERLEKARDSLKVNTKLDPNVRLEQIKEIQDELRNLMQGIEYEESEAPDVELGFKPVSTMHKLYGDFDEEDKKITATQIGYIRFDFRSGMIFVYDLGKIIDGEHVVSLINEDMIFSHGKKEGFGVKITDQPYKGVPFYVKHADGTSHVFYKTGVVGWHLKIWEYNKDGALSKDPWDEYFCIPPEKNFEKSPRGQKEYEAYLIKAREDMEHRISGPNGLEWGNKTRVEGGIQYPMYTWRISLQGDPNIGVELDSGRKEIIERHGPRNVLRTNYYNAKHALESLHFEEGFEMAWQCPKCGIVNQPETEKCAKCGIIPKTKKRIVPPEVLKKTRDIVTQFCKSNLVHEYEVKMAKWKNPAYFKEITGMIIGPYQLLSPSGDERGDYKLFNTSPPQEINDIQDAKIYLDKIYAAVDVALAQDLATAEKPKKSKPETQTLPDMEGINKIFDTCQSEGNKIWRTCIDNKNIIKADLTKNNIKDLLNAIEVIEQTVLKVHNISEIYRLIYEFTNKISKIYHATNDSNVTNNTNNAVYDFFEFLNKMMGICVKYDKSLSTQKFEPQYKKHPGGVMPQYEPEPEVKSSSHCDACNNERYIKTGRTIFNKVYKRDEPETLRCPKCICTTCGGSGIIGKPPKYCVKCGGHGYKGSTAPPLMKIKSKRKPSVPKDSAVEYDPKWCPNCKKITLQQLGRYDVCPDCKFKRPAKRTNPNPIDVNPNPIDVGGQPLLDNIKTEEIYREVRSWW